MRYKKGTLYYIESTCRRLGTRYDIENDRFIPEDEDKMGLAKWYIDHFLKALAIGLRKDMVERNMVKRNVISKDYKTKYKTKKKPT